MSLGTTARIFSSATRLTTVSLGLTSDRLNTSFIRNVQLTGDLVTGDVYIAGMDEGSGCTSGCGSNRSNKIYRSTDGGNTWINSYTGPTFVGACRGNCGQLLHHVQQPFSLLAAHGLG